VRLREAQRAVDAASTRLRPHATRPTARLTPVKLLAFPTQNPRPLTPDLQAEAEACFLKAIEIARKQQEKSWELRAVMSMARLWQQQGKKDEA